MHWPPKQVKSPEVLVTKIINHLQVSLTLKKKQEKEHLKEKTQKTKNYQEEI